MSNTEALPPLGDPHDRQPVDQATIDCWRANYGLDKRTPAKAAKWWSESLGGVAPAGCVAALGVALDELEALRALAAPNVPSEPVAWGVFALVDGTWSMQWPPRMTEAAARADLGMYRPGSVLEVCQLYATPQPAPAGWRLVPVEPTEAMQAVIRNEPDIWADVDLRPVAAAPEQRPMFGAEA